MTQIGERECLCGSKRLIVNTCGDLDCVNAYRRDQRSEKAGDTYDAPTWETGGMREVEPWRRDPMRRRVCRYCGNGFDSQDHTARFCGKQCRGAAQDVYGEEAPVFSPQEKARWNRNLKPYDKRKRHKSGAVNEWYPQRTEGITAGVGE